MENQGQKSSRDWNPFGNPQGSDGGVLEDLAVPAVVHAGDHEVEPSVIIVIDEGGVGMGLVVAHVEVADDVDLPVFEGVAARRAAVDKGQHR